MNDRGLGTAMAVTDNSSAGRPDAISAPDAGDPIAVGGVPDASIDGPSDAAGAPSDGMTGADARPEIADARCIGEGGVCGALLSLARGGIVTSSNPNVPPEDMTKAFDGLVGTKWYAGNAVTTAWIAYQFAGATSHTVTAYAIASANDFPVRDPKDWQLDGSNDGMIWTLVDTRVGEAFINRFQTNRYNCATPGEFRRYRLSVTANNGGGQLQLAEIQLFGN